MIDTKDMPYLRLAVRDIASPVRGCIFGKAIVAIAVTVGVAYDVKSKICCGFGILHDSLCCSHMAGESGAIVSAESSDCI